MLFGWPPERIKVLLVDGEWLAVEGVTVDEEWCEFRALGMRGRRRVRLDVVMGAAVEVDA